MAKKKLFTSKASYGYLLLLIPVLFFYFYSGHKANSLGTSSRLFSRLVNGESVEPNLVNQQNAYGLIMQLLKIIRKTNSNQEVESQDLEIIHRNPQFKSSIAVTTLGKLMDDYCRKRNSPWIQMMNFVQVLTGKRGVELGEFSFSNPMLIGSIADMKEELIDGTSSKCTKNSIN